ncbi:MAG: hypothetical protein AAGM33_11125 [Pseudomonadota bacterium]
MRFINRSVAICWAALMLIFAAPHAVAEQKASVLERISGTWTATGNSFGENVKSRMVWSPVLAGRFHRIDYQIMIDPKKAQSFTGVGHYKATDEQRTTGYWADNGGDLHPLSVEFEDNAIVSIWGVAGKKQGRTEYRMTAADRLMVTDWLLTASGWREFNRAEFVREPS